MPGFMQSIKSHLPLSPFSPNKKSGNAIIPPEVLVSAGEGTAVAEEPSAEVMPGEALVSQNSSTVALTLTPANGEPSHQLPLDDAGVTPSEEPIQQSDAPVQPESTATVTDGAAELNEVPSETVQIDTLDVPAEVTLITPPQSEPPVVIATAVEPSPVTESEVSAEPEHAEEVQPQPEASECKPVEEAVEATVSASEEATTVAVAGEAPHAPEVNASKSSSKAAKENFSCHVKRSKSKKVKSDLSALPEAAEAGESAPSKPRKSHPLSGKFRSVIEQVRSKVKKDKEALVAPPVVTVIEPLPTCEETSVAA